MIKGITYQEIEAIVDGDLAKMFHPKANVSVATKTIIKQETLKLSIFFIDIITTLNQNVDHDSYTENVLNKMDLFALAFEKLLNTIKDKNILRSVGAIWYGFFTEAHSELKGSVDQMLFEYGEGKINKILLAQIRK